MKGIERFFRYIGILTPSDENSQTHPSSACEFNLAHELVKELQALCLDIRVLDENGNEIELKDEDDDDDIVYSSDDRSEVVTGDTNEVLDSGFVFDEEKPDDFSDVFGDMEDGNAETLDD